MSHICESIKMTQSKLLYEVHLNHYSKIRTDLLWWFSDRRIFEQDNVQITIKTFTWILKSFSLAINFTVTTHQLWALSSSYCMKEYCMSHSPRRKICASQSAMSATSMLMMDVGDEMCWWHFWDVGDGFGRFCHQHPLQHYNRAPTSEICHQYRNYVTNIQKLSPR